MTMYAFAVFQALANATMSSTSSLFCSSVAPEKGYWSRLKSSVAPSDMFRSVLMRVGMETKLLENVSALLAILIERLRLVDRVVRGAVDPHLAWCIESDAVRLGKPELKNILLPEWSETNTQLGTPEMQENERLFPAINGKFRSVTALNKPFAEVSAEIDLRKKFTQTGLRRTFQDLARSARLRDEVRRRICGHITSAMTDRYSTLAQVEQRESIGKVLALMTSDNEPEPGGGAPTRAGGAPPP